MHQTNLSLKKMHLTKKQVFNLLIKYANHCHQSLNEPDTSSRRWQEKQFYGERGGQEWVAAGVSLLPGAEPERGREKAATVRRWHEGDRVWQDEPSDCRAHKQQSFTFSHKDTHGYIHTNQADQMSEPPSPFRKELMSYNSLALIIVNRSVISHQVYEVCKKSPLMMSILSVLRSCSCESCLRFGFRPCEAILQTASGQTVQSVKGISHNLATQRMILLMAYNVYM